MRHAIHIARLLRSIFALMLAIGILQAPVIRAEILDRVEAVVNGKLITLSDVRKETVLLRLLDNQELSPGEVRQILIDSLLFEEQMAQSLGIEAAEAEIEQEFQRIGDLQGLSETDVRQAIARRIKFSKYKELRYRQFIRVTSVEVRAYYENVFAPEARRRGIDPVPPLEGSILETVQYNVREEKLDQEVQQSLEAMRRRSDIEVFD